MARRRNASTARKTLRLETLEQRHLLAAEGLVSHWPLDVRVEQQLRDDGPANNHLTAPALDFVDSDRGRSIQLESNTGDITDAESSLGEIENRITVGAWINRDPQDEGGTAFSIAPLGVELRATGDQLRFSISTTEGNQRVVEGEFEFQDNTWYHVAGTFNGENLVAYVNGSEVGRLHTPSDLKIDGNIVIGSSFRGLLDDIKLFNRSLNAEQIGELSRAHSALESSNDASVYHAGGDPVAVDPAVEISSDRDHFQGGQFVVQFLGETRAEGDVLAIARTERIAVEGENVFFSKDGTSTRIGEVDDSVSNQLRVMFNSSATPQAVEALGRAVTFDSNADTPAAHERSLLLKLSTHEGATPFADQRAVTIGQPAATLALETSPGASEFRPGDGAIIVDSGVEVAAGPNDFDNGSLRVSLVEQSGRQSDQLTVGNTELISVAESNVRFLAVSPAVVLGAVSGGENGNPLVIELNADATAPAIEALARAIQYNNTADNTPDHARFVRFLLNDGHDDVADVRKIEIAHVNVAPVITFAEGATEFTPGSDPVVVGPHVEVEDADSPNFGGGKLVASFAEQSRREGDELGLHGSDDLVIDGANVFLATQSGNVRVGEFRFDDGALVIEFNDAATVAVVQTVARHITFGNARQEISNDDRFIRFKVFDGDGGDGQDLKKIEIAVAHVNVAPVIEFAEGATEFTAGADPVVIGPQVEISDSDSPNFGGGKLVASFAEQSKREGDELGLRGSDDLVIDGSSVFLPTADGNVRIGEFGFTDDALVIEFNDAATVAAVQIVARHITFGSQRQEISNDDRFIRFKVFDGDGGDGHDLKKIEIAVAHVNIAPVIEFAEGATEFTAGSDPVVVGPRVEISDSDSPDFDGGKLVASFAEGSRREGDQLALSPSDLIRVEGNDLFLSLAGSTLKIAETSFDDGSLIIEFNANATVGNVQNVARRITFGNDRPEISNDDRFIRFKVFDGDGGDAHDLKKIEISIPETNVDPIVEVAEGATHFDVLGDAVIIAPRIEIGDADSANFAGGALTARFVEQTGSEHDSFGIREGEGIEVDGHRILLRVEDERVLLGEVREIAGNELDLVIDLTEHATPARVQRMARQVTFASTVETAAENDVRFVRFEVADGDGGSGSDVKKIELVDPDRDADGVDDDVESDAPNGGDGNHDGVPDSQQDRVASIRGDGDHYVTFASPENTRLLNVESTGLPSAEDVPAEFPVGFFDFEVEGVEPTESTMVALFLEPGTSANTYYQFGPTPDDSNPHWYPFLFDGETGAKIFSDRIELYYVDGGRGDSDLTENGVVADPGAPGLVDHPWQNPTDVGDVNKDGKTSALDALNIINDIARFSTRDLPTLPVGTEQIASLFLDVTGDGQVTAGDALGVINLLGRSAAQSESEWLPTQAIDDDDDDDKRRTEQVDAAFGELF